MSYRIEFKQQISKIDEYSYNKATYMNIQELINCIYHITNIHILFMLSTN
jgi:hypothetical protein